MEVLLKINNMPTCPIFPTAEAQKPTKQRQISRSILLQMGTIATFLRRAALFIYTISRCDHRIMCEYIIMAENHGSDDRAKPLHLHSGTALLRVCCMLRRIFGADHGVDAQQRFSRMHTHPVESRGNTCLNGKACGIIFVLLQLSCFYDRGRLKLNWN